MDMAISDMEKLVNELYKESNSLKYHRYKSMIYCFKFFQENVIGKNPDEKTFDLAALNLMAYLASWGMYRGSSFMLRCNYKVFVDLIKELKTYNFDPYNIEKNNPQEVVKCFNYIDNYLKPIKKDYSRRKAPNDNIGTTLITKIMLGVFGITPAFDKFFVMGLSTHKEFGFKKTWYQKTNKFEDAYDKLLDFYRENKEVITKLGKDNKTDDVEIPPMRVIDIYFWKLGKNLKNL